MPFKGFGALLRRTKQLVESYPDTAPHRLAQKDRELRLRRATNRVARASRKRNRP